MHRNSVGHSFAQMATRHSSFCSSSLLVNSGVGIFLLGACGFLLWNPFMRI